MILAAVDIGSNAARLLICETSIYKNGEVDFTKLCLLRIPLRLGFDVFETGYISAVKRQKLIDTLKAYKLLMSIYQVEAYKACATSAMRDAGNGEQIRHEIQEYTGFDIKIISGREEASILYETHIADQLSQNKAHLYIDVGGGSTEVSLFANGKTQFQESFNIGTIRLLHKKVAESQWDELKEYIKENTKHFHPIEAIGSGGNINKIFSLSKRKDGKPLHIDMLKDFHKEMSSLSIDELKHHYKLRNDRADVIVPALLVYLSIMRWAEADEIYVPKMGLADGLIKMLYLEKMNGIENAM